MIAPCRYCSWLSRGECAVHVSEVPTAMPGSHASLGHSRKRPGSWRSRAFVVAMYPACGPPRSWVLQNAVLTRQRNVRSKFTRRYKQRAGEEVDNHDKEPIRLVNLFSQLRVVSAQPGAHAPKPPDTVRAAPHSHQDQFLGCLPSRNPASITEVAARRLGKHSLMKMCRSRHMVNDDDAHRQRTPRLAAPLIDDAQRSPDPVGLCGKRRTARRIRLVVACR